MGKTKQERKERRQQIVQNIKTFIDPHDGKLLPFVRAVVESKLPVAGMIWKAIDEARESKLPNDTKSLTIQHLTELAEISDAEQTEQTNRILNGTVVSKFTNPANLLLSAIAFYGMIATKILFFWGVIEKDVDPAILMTLSAIYGSLHGINIIGRADLKKAIV